MTSAYSTPPPPPVAYSEPSLDKERHKTYWLRCLRTFLPWQYTSGDSNRLSLAYFTLSALDLLGCLHTALKPEEKEGYIQWLYTCQHPNGGFRGSLATDLGEQRTAENAVWDPPSVPGTFFALASLCILGDDLAQVKRRECLAFVNKVQRSDGSFGETLGEDGRIEGGRDSRFGYCATGTRWMLRDNAEGEVDGVPDIDVDSFVQCTRISQTYDGGISEAPFHEAHAGFTFTAIASLAFLSRLPISYTSKEDPKAPLVGLTDLPLTLHWLLSRQTSIISDDEALSENEDDETTQSSGTFPYVGCNGRSNKIADTCYSWWVLGSLSILGKLGLCNHAGNRRYLLEKTQHRIGGFGKLPGDPPDLFHSYLGLATLSLLKEDSLSPINPALCFSERAKEHLEKLPWRKAICG